VLDAVALIVMAALVSRLMIAARVEAAAAPAIEEV
jgi:hypothetical protein